MPRTNFHHRMLCREILLTVFLGRPDDTAEAFSPHETKVVVDFIARKP